MSGLNYLFVGADNPEAFMIGNDEVEVIYMGEEIVYQKGDGSGISMRSKAKVGTKSGSTYNLKITSSEPWTLSVDTAVTWLNFSQLTGDTGETIVTITATEDNQTGDNRATTITATTANYSATCEVTQIAVIYVDYIHKSTLESSTNYYIDTGIFPTTATKMRFVYMGKGLNSSAKFLGFSWGGEEDVYKGATDDSDYRYFGGGGHIYWDYNNSRLENENFNNYSNGVLYDVEIGNNYVKNNLNEAMIVNGTAQTNPPTPNIPIMVNVSCIWLKSLQIWEGQTIVFDGQAAVENNVIGLYDSITESMFTTSAITLTYEPTELYTWTDDIDNVVYREGDIYRNTTTLYAIVGKLNYTLDHNVAIMQGSVGGDYYRFYLKTDGVISIYSYNSSNPQQETFVTDVAAGAQYIFPNTNTICVNQYNSNIDFGVAANNATAGITMEILNTSN